EAREAKDLPAPQREAHVADRAAAREAADVEDDVRVGDLRDLRSAREDRPADHHADDLVDRRVLRLDGRDVLAIAHHRDAIRDALELLQAMRDMHDTDAAL